MSTCIKSTSFSLSILEKTVVLPLKFDGVCAMAVSISESDRINLPIFQLNHGSVCGFMLLAGDLDIGQQCCGFTLGHMRHGTSSVSVHFSAARR